MRLLRRVTILGVASMLVLGAGNWWPSAEESPRRREIRMRGNSFAPREVRVAVGDTVVWVNGDIVRHNAVRRDLFDSGELRSGERFAWVPVDTGTVRYQCTIHSRMRGTIQVTKSN
jgi:plastocyanin